MKRPEMVNLPPEFGGVLVNPWRIDTIQVMHGATRSVVRLYIRDRHYDTIPVLDAGQAATVVAAVITLIGEDPT